MPIERRNYVRVQTAQYILAAVCVIACTDTMPQTPDERWRLDRQRMVEQQLRARDIRSAAVLDAMGPSATARRSLNRTSSPS
jgi:hypothetical protein